MGKCCVTDRKNCKMSNNNYVTAARSSSKHEIAMIWWSGKVSFFWMESPFLKILPVCLSHLSKCHTTSFLEVRSQCTTFCRHNRLSNKCYTITLDYTLELPHPEFSVYLPYSLVSNKRNVTFINFSKFGPLFCPY